MNGYHEPLPRAEIKRLFREARAASTWRGKLAAEAAYYAGHIILGLAVVSLVTAVVGLVWAFGVIR